MLGLGLILGLTDGFTNAKVASIASASAASTSSVTATETISGTVAGASAASTSSVTAGAAPLGQANIQAYYQSDLGITTVSGGVSQWLDQSGNSNTLSQSTGATRPTYTATMNGRTVLSFSGTQFLTLAAANTLTDATVLAVVRTSSTKSTSTYPGDPGITAVGDPTGGVVSGFGVNNGKTQQRTFTGATPWPHADGVGTVNDGNPHTIGFTASNAGADPMQNYLDGAADGSSVNGGGAGEWAAVGTGQSINDSWVGDIAAVVVVKRILSGSEITQWGNFFKVYYGTPG